MFDEVLKWPDPITADNALSVDVDSIYDARLHGQQQTLERFISIISDIKAGLEATSDPKIFDSWDFHLTRQDHLNLYADFLNRIRATAQQQPNILQSGNWIYNGSQVGPWNINYDPSSGGFNVTNDPYIASADVNRQSDFGLLFEIGRDTKKMSVLTRGGKNSVLTKAALQSIDDKAIELISKLETTASEKTNTSTEQLDSATRERVAEIKTVQAAKDWSEHYEIRCKELELLIDGGVPKKFWKICRFSWPRGLKRIRRYWYFALLVVLAAYAYVAFQIIHGEGAFKISGNLDATLTGFGRYFVGLTLYGLLAGIYLGYSFMVRQLKVHQNLLEQYRHRAIVAKTIENIVYAVVKTREGTAEPGQESALRTEDLDKFVHVAATSMFEYRPIGHLSTKEGSSIFGDILNGRNS